MPRGDSERSAGARGASQLVHRKALARRLDSILEKEVRRMRIFRLISLLGFVVLPLSAHAQTYPSKSITAVVPFPAGGPSDVVARIVTEHMSRTLRQQIVIENVGGAGGALGTARVAAAPPDGYTLLAGSMGSHVAAPVLTPNVKYDSERDFEPIGLTAHAPAVIVARKDFPAKNVSEFVAYLKQNGARLPEHFHHLGTGFAPRTLTVGHIPAGKGRSLSWRPFPCRFP